MNTNKGVSAMTLQSSGAISLDQIRTEYGISGAVSMNQLYRGGSYVDSTKEVTDAISSVTEGYSVVSGTVSYGSSSAWGQEGYSQRWNHGNLNAWSFSNTTNQGFYGGRYPGQYGYLINGQQTSSALQSLDASNGGGSKAGQYGYYVNNGESFAAQPDTILDMKCTCDNGLSQDHSLECTIGRAGDYYVWDYANDSGVNSLKVEVDTGSGFSTVYDFAYIGSSYTKRYDATDMSVGDKIKITLRGVGEKMVYAAFLSTSTTTHADKTINVSTTVPASGAITFSNFYGGENA